MLSLNKKFVKFFTTFSSNLTKIDIKSLHIIKILSKIMVKTRSQPHLIFNHTLENIVTIFYVVTRTIIVTRAIINNSRSAEVKMKRNKRDFRKSRNQQKNSPPIPSIHLPMFVGFLCLRKPFN